MAIRKFRAVTAFNCAGQYACIVQHFITDDSSGSSPFVVARRCAQALFDPDAGGNYYQELADALSDDSYISSLRVSEVGIGNPPAFVQLFGPDDFPGSFGDDLDAAMIAGNVICVTADAGTPNGRNYYPGVATTAYANGLPSAGYKSALDDVATVLLNDIEKDGNVFNFALKHGSPAQYSLVAHMYLSSTAGTQRRRLTPF